MKKITRTPQEAATTKQVSEIPRSYVAWGDFWFLTDGYRVTICEQRNGEPAKQRATIPKHVFDKFVRFYQTGSMRKGR